MDHHQNLEYDFLSKSRSGCYPDLEYDFLSKSRVDEDQPNLDEINFNFIYSR